MADRYYGTRRIVRLAILRRSNPRATVGAYRLKVWPSYSRGHRDTRALFFSLSPRYLLRLIYRTATTTATKCRRLGIVH